MNGWMPSRNLRSVVLCEQPVVYLCLFHQMRQGSFKGLSVVQREKNKHGGYQTKVVAGVIHRTPIQVG